MILKIKKTATWNCKVQHSFESKDMKSSVIRHKWYCVGSDKGLASSLSWNITILSTLTEKKCLHADPVIRGFVICGFVYL